MLGAKTIAKIPSVARAHGRADFESYKWILLGLLSMGLAVFVLTLTALCIAWNFTVLPYWETWFELSIEDLWRNLFAQSNEHRILFPRLVFMIDKAAFGGSHYFNVAVTLGLQFVQFILLMVLAWSAGPRDRTALVCLGGILLAMCFWMAQRENFVIGFQVSFVMVFVAATAAMTALCLGKGGVVTNLCAAGLAVVSAFSMANGLLAPVCLTFGAILLRRPWFSVLAWAAFSALAMLIYLFGYRSPAGLPDFTNALERIMSIPLFVASYLGNFLAYPTRPKFSIAVTIALGIAGMAAYAGFLFRLLVAPRAFKPAHIALVLVMSFVIVSALLTAIGRAGFFPILWSHNSRYVTATALFWSALAILTFSLLDARRRWWSLAGTIVVLATLAFVVKSQQLTIARVLGDRLRFAETAVLVHAHDTEALQVLFQDPEFVYKRIPRLRQLRLSVFAAPWSQWLGANLPSVAHVLERSSGNGEGTASRCSGRLEQALRLPAPDAGVVRVRGFASIIAGRPIERIVMTDAEGRVVGYALGRYRRERLSAETGRMETDFLGWRGHAVVYSASELRGYAVLDGGKTACRLDGSVRLDRPPP